MNLAVFQTVGPLELLIVLGIVLMIFGPKRLPGMGKALGSGMREFKDGIVNPVEEVKEEFANPMAEEKPPIQANLSMCFRPTRSACRGTTRSAKCCSSFA